MSHDMPAGGRFEDKAHLLPVRVYYEDTDFTGFVYHANYLRFMERGRSEMLRLMAAQHGSSPSPVSGFAVVHMSIDYMAAARIHDALLVCTRFEEAKGPRLYFSQEVRRSGTLLCQARVTAVPITPEGRARRPTAAELQHWKQFCQAAA